MVQVRSQTQSNVNVFSASVNLLGLVRSENINDYSAVLFAKAVLLRSPPPQAAVLLITGVPPYTVSSVPSPVCEHPVSGSSEPVHR